MTFGNEKLWHVTGTDRRHVSHIIRVRAADYSAAMHKASQLPRELIVVHSCVLMEEILGRWKSFLLPDPMPHSDGLSLRKG
jgi:hypothetical protein